MKTRCFLRKGLGDPGLGQVQRGNSLSSLATLGPLPIPLHSSRQAAIGLLLHDCPLHKVLRPSCLQQSLKFPSPTSPFLPAGNALESTAVYLLPLRYCHQQHHDQASGGPGPLCPRTKMGPSSWCKSYIPRTLSRLVLTQAHRPQVQLGSGIPSSPKADGTMYKHTW